MADNKDLTLDELLAKEAETHAPELQCKIGEYYEHNENSEEAFKWYSLAAAQEYPEGQCNLGLMYYYGKGVECDYKKANELLTLSGNIFELRRMQVRIADEYFDKGNKGYDEDSYDENLDEALNWYLPVADDANDYTDYAQNRAGYIYEKQKNYTEAIKWFKRASKKNNVNAQYNLGRLYYRGLGVQKDTIQAGKLFEKALRNGYDYGILLNFCFEYGDSNNPDKFFFELLKNGAKKGDGNRLVNVLNILLLEADCTKEIDNCVEEAYRWLSGAIKKGFVKEDFLFGDEHEFYWVDYDDENWAESKWVQNYAKLCAKFGYNKSDIGKAFYDKGFGGDAAPWWILAAKEGEFNEKYMDFLLDCADRYHNGYHFEMAIKCYSILAEKGETYAMCNMGECYRDLENYELEFYWYKKAADLDKN